jgi:hypothetical protein
MIRLPAVNRTVLAQGRLGAGALGLVAIGVQLVAAAQTAHFNAANFFSYFTILSNVFAAIVLVYSAVRRATPSHRLDVLRGAATVSMVLVGIVFSLLLAALESDIVPWVNVVLHYVMPVVLAADWLIDPPRQRLTMIDGFWWLVLPLAYLIYTLIRGAIVHWYPYPFLDVKLTGAATVGTYVLAIFAAASILVSVVRGIGNRLRTLIATPSKRS